MRQLSVILDAMETTKRSAPEDGEVGDDEIEYVEEEEVVGEQEVEEQFLRFVLKLGTREKI
jgi:hypothetical protein